MNNPEVLLSMSQRIGSFRESDFSEELDKSLKYYMEETHPGFREKGGERTFEVLLMEDNSCVFVAALEGGDFLCLRLTPYQAIELSAKMLKSLDPLA